MKFKPPKGADLLEVLGDGSIFSVAIVEYQGQIRVCKRLRERMIGEALAHKALQREAHVLQSLTHCRIPLLFAYDSDEFGPFILQSKANGVPLGQLWRSLQQRGLTIAPTLLMACARSAFELLDALHSQSKIADLSHGDLAPDHLLVTPDAVVSFVDFGQARWRKIPTELCSSKERGTLPYVAPELARGERAASQQDDVFALSATLMHVLLDKRLLQAESSAVMLLEAAERGIQLKPLDHIAEAHRPLARVLTQALAFDPTKRLRDAREVLARLGS